VDRLKIKRIATIVLIFLPIYLLRLRAKLQYPFKTGDKIKITAKLKNQPTTKGRFQYFTLKNIFISASSTSQLDYNDWVEAVGTISKSEHKSIIPQYQIQQAQIKKIDKTNRLSPIFKFRDWANKLFKKSLPQPHASLLAGIVLGIKSSLPSDFSKNLQTTGTLHIVVASGMNISLFSATLADFLARLFKKKIAFIVSLICILIYCVIAGMQPPIIRAALMALILFMARFWGRESLSLYTLFIVGIIMLVANPLLLFDVGFQLSFTATAGLILLGPHMQRLVSPLPIGFFKESLAETASAQIFTLPIIMITFGNFNPISIIPNALVLELIPFFMISGFVLIALFPIAPLIGLVLWLPLEYFVGVINLFGRLKIFNINL